MKSSVSCEREAGTIVLQSGRAETRLAIFTNECPGYPGQTFLDENLLDILLKIGFVSLANATPQYGSH